MLYGMGFIITKLALTTGSPLFLIASRMLIASGILLAYQWFFNRRQFIVPKAVIAPLVVFGILYMYLANAFEFWGLNTLTPTKVAFLYNLSPFIAALLEALYKKTKLTLLQWLGICISFFGASVLTFSNARIECLSYLFLSCGELLLIGAIAATIAGSLVLQGLVKDAHYSSIMTNGIGMLVGGSCALVHSLFTESWNPIPVIDPLAFMGWTALMIILYNIIAYELYNRLSRYYSITFLTLSWLTTPFFTAFFEYIILGTPLIQSFVFAYLLVFFGFFCFYYKELRTLKT